MRLLHLQDSGELSLVERVGDNIPPYAILSHTWGPNHEEVSYGDVCNGTGKLKNGYRKLTFCGKQAAQDGLQYFWVDTACIDKTSSAELSEAINSMYSWYQAADVCYAYLADVPSQNSFSRSKWFTRGWTLQELLAPDEVIFYDENCNPLGSKSNLCQIVSECSRIPAEMLSGDKDLDSFSIAQRMSWAATRNTSRVEDQAYCLLGIFDINMPLIYGEGQNAFIRLQEEIMKISDDHSLFAWRSNDDRSGCLATSPASFLDSWNIVQYNHTNMSHDPTISGSKGIYMDLRFMGIGPGRLGFVILDCCEHGKENECIGIYLRDLSIAMQRFERVWSHKLAQFDFRMLELSKFPIRRVCIRKGRIARTQRIRTYRELESVNLPPYGPTGSIERLMDSSRHYASLVHAIKVGTEDDVWMLLTRADIDVNAQDKGGRSAISHAAMNGKTIEVSMLLSRNEIHLDQEDTSGRSPLSLAAGNGHEAIVKLLLDTGKVKIEGKDNNGLTPLSWAAAKGQESTLELLLDTGKVDVDSNNSDRAYHRGNGETPLFRAVLYGHEKVVKLLISTGKINFNGVWNGQTLLFCAVLNDHEAIVKLLLSTGQIDVDATKNGKTPLLVAVLNRNERVVKLLLDTNQVDVNAEWHGLTPMIAAASAGNEALVTLLLSTGKVQVDKESKKNTPLLSAALNGHVAIVELLLNNGQVDIEATDLDGQTPLLLAAMKGHERVVRSLIKFGGRVDSRDLSGRSPLLFAAMNGHEAVVKTLLSASAINVDAPNHHGQSPLFLAAAGGHEAIVKLLLATGEVDVRRTDKYGQAASSGNMAVVELLQDAMIGRTHIQRQVKWPWKKR